MKIIMLLPVILLLVLFSVLYPQQSIQYKFQQISSGNPLSNSNVHRIFQDKNGFLWFCTEDGLNKYDGYEFTIYKKEPNNNKSLSDNYIYSVCEDNEGIFWVATNNGGLNRFNPGTGESVRYESNPSDTNSINSNSVIAVLADRFGDVWAGTVYNGLNRFDRKTGRFIHYSFNPNSYKSISSNNITSLYEDKFGEIWIGTRDGGLNKYVRKSDSFESIKNIPGNKQSINSNYVLSFFESKDNFDSLLWIGTLNGVNSFNRKTGKFTSYFFGNINRKNSFDFSQTTVVSIVENRKNILWLATFEGIISFNTVTGKFQRIKYIENYSYSLNGNRILYLFKDKSGIIWISALEKGVNKYEPILQAFRQYKPRPNAVNSLSRSIIRAIEEDSYGNLWLGTLGAGIDIIERNYNKIKHLRSYPDEINGLSSNEISSIYQDRAGNMWIGTWTSGLNKLDASQFKTSKKGTLDVSSLKLKNYKTNPNNPGSLQNNIVQAIYESTHRRDGVLWIGTGQGLNVLNKKNENFIHLLHDPSDPNSISDDRIQSKCIMQDRNNNLWIGTWNGLNKLTPDKISKFLEKNEQPSFIHYYNNPGNSNSLSDNRVISIYEDNSGTFWVGTYGSGLNKIIFKFDKANGRESAIYKNYSIKNGLSGDIIYGILEDESNNLWISTNNGLSKFDKKNETFLNYASENEPQGSKYYWGSYCKRKNGELIFGGTNGFTAFFPREVTSETYMAPVLLTSFKVFDKQKTLPNAIYETKEISLPYDNNFFSFEFASLDFTAPEKNKFICMLEGFDEDWVQCGTRRYISYTNVTPGKYIFRVKGTNSQGLWNKQEATIKIIIVPPFWKTIWFRILSAVILIGLLLYTYKIRVKRIEMQNLKLSQEIESRRKIEEVLINAKENAERSERLISEFLAQMSHEIRTPVNSILSFSSLLRNELEDSVNEDLKTSFSIIENGGRRLIRTIDMILNMSAIQAGVFEIKPGKINIFKDVLEKLISEFSSAASIKKIELKLEVKTDNTIIIADLYTVTQIFANLIDNAIKYTPSGNVTVSFDRTELGKLCVHVKDTGIGIAKEFIPHLFDAFTQEETGYTRRFEGTGLGLSLVKKFVEMNNAGISVVSEKGKGSDFSINFD